MLWPVVTAIQYMLSFYVILYERVNWKVFGTLRDIECIEES